MDKPARKITRKRGSDPARIVKRPAAIKAPRGAAGKSPRFSRITTSLDLIAPQDCHASVILKQVAHAKGHYYACWLVVGRYDQDAVSVRFKFTGEKTLRCDVPNGTLLSPSVMQPHLVRFLKTEGTLEDGPPIITGKGHEP
jgi:hypothetical protein